MLALNISLPDLKAQVSAYANRHSPIADRQLFGGGEGIRTPDPRVANAVLCQLSYAPDKAESQIPDSRFQRLVAGAGFEPATFGL